MNKIIATNKYEYLVGGLNNLSTRHSKIQSELELLKKTASDTEELIFFLKNYPIFNPSCRQYFKNENEIASLEKELKQIRWQIEQYEVEKEELLDCYIKQLDTVLKAKTIVKNYGVSDEDIEEIPIKRIKK